MSYSWTTFDEVVRHVLQTLQPARILDIGAGQGKYGKMARAAGLSAAEITAVECDTSLNAGLATAGYSEVLNITGQQLLDQPNQRYDLVIMGDVIEHMKHSDGQDLLEFLNYRSRYLLIITPECMPMNTPDFYAGHNSLWTPRAMQWHDLWAHQRCRLMHFYLLRGYLDFEAMPLFDMVASVNAQGFVLKMEEAPFGETSVPCRLTITDQVISDPIPGDLVNYCIYRPR
jgi:hypothetical protein